MFGINKNKDNNKKELSTRESKRTSRKCPPSLISFDVNFLGNMISEGTLDIDGKIDGNLRANNIVIRNNGCVNGDVVAKTVSASGKIIGIIRAQEVTLLDGAFIKGTIIYEKLIMEEGAVVDAKFKQQSTVTLDDNKNNEGQESILKRFNLIS